MDENVSKTIISLMYVSKNLKKNPLNAIKYITINRKYFKDITDETLDLLKKEYNITNDDLDKVEVPKVSIHDFKRR
jgi:hypothetical protein